MWPANNRADLPCAIGAFCAKLCVSDRKQTRGRSLKAGYEADDFLAAAAAREEKLGGTAIVASGDRDTYQLASERTTIVQPVRAGEVARIGPKEVRARYGVDPKQVPNFIALRGDASDRIPGASGVGAVTAAGILRKYAALEEALAAGRFAREAEKLRMYRAIATMDKRRPCQRSATRSQRGKRLRRLPETGNSTNWPTAWMGSRWHNQVAECQGRMALCSIAARGLPDVALRHLEPRSAIMRLASAGAALFWSLSK